MRTSFTVVFGLLLLGSLVALSGLAAAQQQADSSDSSRAGKKVTPILTPRTPTTRPTPTPSPTPTPRRVTRYSYAVPVTCGLDIHNQTAVSRGELSEPPARPGQYYTFVSVHNPTTQRVVVLRHQYSSRDVSKGDNLPFPPQPQGTFVLAPHQEINFYCSELNPDSDQGPAPFMHGIVDLTTEVLLNVNAHYSVAAATEAFDPSAEDTSLISIPPDKFQGFQ